MDYTVYKAIYGIIILVGLLLIYAGFLLLLFNIFKWILNKKPVKKRASFITQYLQGIWKCIQMPLEDSWEYFSKLYIEPLGFAFVVFILFNKLQSFMDYAQVHPESSILQMVNQDMERDMNFYWIFLVVFFLWMFGKTFEHNRQVRDKREITKALKENTKVLKALARKLEVPESEFTADEEKYTGIKDKSKSISISDEVKS